MNLDEVRKKYKTKRTESSRNSADKRETGNSSKDKRKETTDMSVSTDISVAFISNDNFYFCFGETGQKLKISMTSFKDSRGNFFSVEDIVDKVDLLQISSSNKSSEDIGVYKFCKSVPTLLKSADRIMVFYTDSVQSYKNAVDIQEIYRKLVPTRLISEDQIASVGAVGKNVTRYEDENISYGFRYGITDVNVGDGVIEIRERRKKDVYAQPPIKDIIKGLIIQYGIVERHISNVLPLYTFPFELNLLILENKRVRNVHKIFGKDTSIPTRSTINIDLDPNQEAVVEVANRLITSDISSYFSKISHIECDANQDIIIYGKKDGEEAYISVSALEWSCSR